MKKFEEGMAMKINKNGQEALPNNGVDHCRFC